MQGRKSPQLEAVSRQPRLPAGREHGAPGPAEFLRRPVGPPSPCHGLAHGWAEQGGGTACGPPGLWSLAPPQSDQEESWKLLLKKETELSGGMCRSKPRIRAQLPTRLRVPAGAGWAAASPRSGLLLPPLWAVI